jgi:hypothetical protein
MTSLSSMLQLRAIIPVVLLDPDLSGVPPVTVNAPLIGKYLFSIRDIPDAAQTAATFLIGGLPEEVAFFGGYAFVTDLGVVDSAVDHFQIHVEWDRAFHLIGRTSPVPVRGEGGWKFIRGGGVICLQDNRGLVIAGAEDLFLSEAKAAVTDMRAFSRALRPKLLGLVPDETLRYYFADSEESEQ